MTIGPDILIPLLRRLVDQMDSQDYRESAHHVLWELYHYQEQTILKPVLESLDSEEPEDHVPVAVQRVLDELTHTGLSKVRSQAAKVWDLDHHPAPRRVIKVTLVRAKQIGSQP